MSHPQARLAIDPVAFFVLLVIVVNIVASIAKALKRAAAGVGAAKTAIKDAKADASQAARPAVGAAKTVAATRAAELERLRQALLTAAQTPAQAPLAQKVTQAVQTIQKVTPYRLSSSPIPASGLQQAVQTASDMVAAALPTEWALAPGGALMTLESGATAFNQLDGSAPLTAAPLVAPAAAAFDIVRASNNGASLFIAAAIVGPCAAFRPSGHTPGGW